MTSRRLTCFAAVVLVGSSTFASAVSAQDRLLGRWRDTAPAGDPVGFLDIAGDSISVGRKVTYQVKPVGAFGGGQLYQVTGMNRRQDPEGCGPGGKVRFIAAQPAPTVAPGIGRPGIRVFFYSGGSAPTLESITNDIALCSIRPFSR